MKLYIIPYSQMGRRLILSFIFFLLFVFASYLNVEGANIYIDPTYLGGNSNGSESSPFLSWNDITEFQDNTSYFQKRGTTCTISGSLKLYRKSNINFGVYGTGTDYAHIHNTSTGNVATFNIGASNNCSLDGFYLTASYETLCGILVGDDWQTSNYSGNDTKISNCLIENFHWGIRMMKLGNSPFDNITVENVTIQKIYEDGIFIQGWGTPLHGVDINNCHIEAVNMAYQETGGGDQTVAGGDGIQISRLVDDWIIRNTTVDRRNSSNKFCIIHNDEGGTQTCGGTIENCILYAPNIGAGGIACYLASLKSVTFRNNRVFVNEKGSALMLRYGTTFNCYYNIFSKIDANGPARLFDIGGGPNYIHNNTFYGASQVIAYTSGFTSTEVYNNIFSSAGSVYGGSTATVAKDYNLYFNSISSSPTEPNSIYNQDPLFVDAANGDFHLQAGSPCINSGKNLTYTMDIAGTNLPQGGQYDIGAFEYIPSDTQAPSIPTGLSSSNVTNTGFTLSWNASTDNDIIAGYEVYKNGELTTSTTAVSVNFTDLIQGTTYSMTIKAKDKSGNVSETSSALLVTTLVSTDTQAPSVPSGLTVTQTGQKHFTFSWTASTDNVGVVAYDIYKDGVLLNSTSSSSFVVTNLTAATTYSITVKARDAVNNSSEASSVLSVTTLSACTSGEAWANSGFTIQTSSFVAEFDVVTSGDGMDGVLGLSNGVASSYSGLACILQFYSDGFIKARNGNIYSSETENVAYYSGISYHVKFVVELSSHIYDVYVTPSGANPITIGKGYAFRLEQSSISQLNNYSKQTNSCGLAISNFKIDNSGNTTSSEDPIHLTSDKSLELVSIYPSPAKEEVTIHVSELSILIIMDVSGKVIRNETIKAGNNKMKLDLNPGLYFFQIIGSEKLKSTSKLIIR